MRSFLERYCDRMGNVVLRDANGNPSIFVKHGKINSSDLDASLPDHVHPAFITGNVTSNSILIGKYPCSVLQDGGSTLYSLPNMPPKLYLTHDVTLSGAQSFGSGVSSLTIADHGLLMLLARKYGVYPHGNNANGGDAHEWNHLWQGGQNATVGSVWQMNGYNWTCIKAHTTSNELVPELSPGYWKRGTRNGGTPDKTQNYASAGATSLYRSTLTGSGPLSWYLNNDIGMESDLNGLCEELLAGARLVDCEIQILANNDAASPSADLSASSTAWKAIKAEAGGGYSLVSPGTSGTLHYAWKNNTITLIGRALESAEFVNQSDGRSKNIQFRNMAVDSETVPSVPSIMYELGLFPMPGLSVPESFAVKFAQGELIAMGSGGCTGYGVGAGICYVSFTIGRSQNLVNSGARLRATV